MPLKAVLWGLAATIILAGGARANALDDGNAGLQALNSGDYDHAIGLFTKAIDSHRLKKDDQEFAYANRGRAYLKKGDYSSAIVDLDRARRAKPDDVDAQNDLVVALSAKLPAAAIPGLPKQSAWGALGHALLDGAIAGIVSGLQQGNAQ
jgi:tetratricopeptide (TPR) repeat protein